MKQTLFDISADLTALTDLLDEMGGDVSDQEIEEAIDAWFNEIGENRDQKLDNYAYLIAEHAARADVKKTEAKRLSERARIDQNRADKLKERLLFFFERHGEKTIETDRFRFTRSNSGGKRKLDHADPDLLPPEFTFPETVIRVQRDDLYDRLTAMEEEGLEPVLYSEEGTEIARLLPRSQYMRIS